MEKDDLIFNNLEIKDYRTDYGKGISYKSIDGREFASMEAVEQANNAYWNSMKIKDYARYAELEKAYFDCITPKDMNMIKQVLAEQQKKFVTFIEERYLKYLSEVMEQYGYGQQDNNRDPKR